MNRTINPTKTVMAIDGKEYPRADCREISNNFYLVGDVNVRDSGHCYYIKAEDKYFRYDTGFIVWDHEKECYVRNNKDIIEGVVGENKQIGHFTPNKIKNCLISFQASSEYAKPCISEQVAQMNGAVQSVEDGIFYAVTTNANFMRSIADLRTVRSGRRGQGYDIEFTYSMAENPDKTRMTATYDAFDKEVTLNAARLHQLLAGFSFGFEAETDGGKVPANALYQNKVLPLRDGSIAGYEYTSLPYTTPKDMQSFIDFFQTLSRFTIINKLCSLHYHIGGFVSPTGTLSEKDMEKVVSLYMLYYQLQKEIWDIIPYYKKKSTYFMEKNGKDHCCDLRSHGLFNNRIYANPDKIDTRELLSNFNIIFRIFNDGYAPDSSYNYKTRKHVKGDARKWEIESRYHCLNLYPILFGGDHARTVEFRAHSATTSIHKALPYLLLCNGIMKFAAANTVSIIQARTKYDLADIIDGYRNNFGEGTNNLVTEEYLAYVADYLEAYVKHRKDTMNEDGFTHSEYNDLSIDKDNKFTFSYNGKDLLTY